MLPLRPNPTTAASLAYRLYRDAIFSLTPDALTGSTSLGVYTESLSYISFKTGFFTEFVAYAILLCVIFAMGDDGNAPPGVGMPSFVIGLVIYNLCICLGYSTGGCLNPVQDFGPQLVASTVDTERSLSRVGMAGGSGAAG